MGGVEGLGWRAQAKILCRHCGRVDGEYIRIHIYI